MHVKFLENKNCKIIWQKTCVNGKFWIISNLFSLPSFDFKPGSETITTTLTFNYSCSNLSVRINTLFY